MTFISSIIGIPLGWIMYAFYSLTNNYVIALFLFTLVTRLVMIPTTLKQQKSSVKMNVMKPQIEELQKKYANNKTKLNEETMKLYQQEGFNPMAGCLPLLITFPILFGLIDVISKPMTHLLRLPSDVINAGLEIVNNNPTLFETGGRGGYYVQLQVIRGVKEMPELFAAMGQDAINAIHSLNLNFFGLTLTDTPSMGLFGQVFSNFDPIIIIPLLAGITSVIMAMITMRNTSGGDAAGAGSMKGMMMIMPLFSFWFSTQVPAGVGMYWIMSNLFATVQSIIMNKVYNPRELAEKARAEAEERRERERKERIEAKKNDPNKNLSAKEQSRRKLAEARKRHAEKYGEEFAEVTDEDLA